MVEHAMEFDADKDGKLSRDELKKFAEDFARHHAGPPGGPGGEGGAGRGPNGPNGPAGGGGSNEGQRSERPRRPE